jgi:hypothetical protein
MHHNLNVFVLPDRLHNSKFVLFVSTLTFFYSFVDEEAQHETDGVWHDPHQSVCLVADSELLCHVEQLVGLKEDILTLENGVGSNH